MPEGESDSLIVAGIALFVSALLIGALTVVQGFAVSRASIRGQQRLQQGVWDRLLSLPVPFFRTEGSGSMASRVLAVESLQQVVSTSTVTTLLSSVFTLFNFILLFVYSPLLGAVAVVLIAIVAVATWWFARRIIAATRPLIAQDRLNSSHINEILRALSKIRGARAEDRFFALHAEGIRRKVVFQDRQQQIGIRLSVFYASLTIIMTSTLYVVIGTLGWDDATDRAEISPATYIAFITAFNAVLGATVALGQLIQPLSIAGPTIAALRPIMETEPERSELRKDPGRLTGAARAAQRRLPLRRRRTARASRRLVQDRAR